jgi:hypothetical protein
MILLLFDKLIESPPHFIRKGLTKFQTPLPDRLIGHEDATGGQ